MNFKFFTYLWILNVTMCIYDVIALIFFIIVTSLGYDTPFHLAQTMATDTIDWFILIKFNPFWSEFKDKFRRK